MRILIVEDECPLAEKIKEAIVPKKQEVETFDSSLIDSIVETIYDSHSADMIVMSSKLINDHNITHFRQVTEKYPILFTEYFQQKDHFCTSKCVCNRNGESDAKCKIIDTLTNRTANEKTNGTAEYKNRFLIKERHKWVSLPISQISYFFADDRLCFARTKDGKKHIIEFTMEELNFLLDPNTFFRVNRSFIVSIESIEGVYKYFNNRLKLKLIPNIDRTILVSKEKVQEFKNWIGK